MPAQVWPLAWLKMAQSGGGGAAQGAAGNPQQVRIQQHFSIRISPGAPVLPPAILFADDEEERETRVVERRMARCIPVGAIAGVQSAARNRLVIFLRDSRVVVAALEKSCQAHDFYSGFYLDRHADGQLCVGRDTIHARSGATCGLRSLRALVEVPAKR